MTLRTSLRAAVATAACAAAMAVPAAPAQAADSALVCGDYIKIENIQLPGYVNCMLDAAGNLIVRVGDCVFFYDPLFSPIPSHVVPETVELANCIV
jgi:hypothetical protein